MHSLLERALVIRTETVSRKRILDGKFTGSPITVPWSEQLRFIFGKEILSFSFPSRAPRAFKYNMHSREMATRLPD